MKRNHLNFCKECRKAFEITDNVDVCNTCKVILDINCGEFSGVTEENENNPEIIRAIMKRYMAYGYE